ncbi:MAG TPA: phosphate-starvation-inducible PsiE family protein [Candidatus Angelobacter sp.]
MNTSPDRTAYRPRRLLELGEKLVRLSEFFVVCAAGLLVIAAVIFATFALYGLFINGLHANFGSIASIEHIQDAIQHVFAGVLLLMLGLELLETLKTYFQHYHIRTEVILVVAMIAVGRHIIQFDFEHTSGSVLAGMAALMLALAISYYLVRTRSVKALDAKMTKPLPGDQHSANNQFD